MSILRLSEFGVWVAGLTFILRLNFSVFLVVFMYYLLKKLLISNRLMELALVFLMFGSLGVRSFVTLTTELSKFIDYFGFLLDLNICVSPMAFLKKLELYASSDTSTSDPIIIILFSGFKSMATTFLRSVIRLSNILHSNG